MILNQEPHRISSRAQARINCRRNWSEFGSLQESALFWMAITLRPSVFSYNEKKRIYQPNNDNVPLPYFLPMPKFLISEGKGSCHVPFFDRFSFVANSTEPAGDTCTGPAISDTKMAPCCSTATDKPFPVIVLPLWCSQVHSESSKIPQQVLTSKIKPAST